MQIRFNLAFLQTAFYLNYACNLDNGARCIAETSVFIVYISCLVNSLLCNLFSFLLSGRLQALMPYWATIIKMRHNEWITQCRLKHNLFRNDYMFFSLENASSCFQTFLLIFPMCFPKFSKSSRIALRFIYSFSKQGELDIGFMRKNHSLAFFTV